MNSAGNLVPAFVTGTVALMSAVTSAIIAIYSIHSNSRERREARSQETALNLLPRRLDAYEAVWRGLLMIEQKRYIDAQLADSLVEKSVWLPRDLRSCLLELLLEDTVNFEKARKARSLLLEDAAVKNMDVAMSRLREARGDQSGK